MEEEPAEATLESQFSMFAQTFDSHRTGETITLYRSDYWMRQAKLLDDRKLTMTDTGIAFNKFSKTELDWDEWNEYLGDLCDALGLDEVAVKDTLTNCGNPGQYTVTVPKYRDYFLTWKPKDNNYNGRADGMAYAFCPAQAHCVHIEQLARQQHHHAEDTTYCVAAYDSYLCWPPTPSGETASQHCPEARLSDTRHMAFRRCGEGGLWLGKNGSESQALGWTNFTPCFPVEAQNLLLKLLEKEVFQIAKNTRYLEIAGFALSLMALAISYFIFSHFRSLRNDRTRIHKNLFGAMLLQVVVRLTIYIDQAIASAVEENHWYTGIEQVEYLCKFLYSLLEYGITVMFHWMFIEGLHLHNMVTAKALRNTVSFPAYYAIGWVFPIVLTGVWSTITAYSYQHASDSSCWYGYNFGSVYWILQVPRIAVVAMNFIFLLNILRGLVTKLRDSENNDLQVTRKATRAALVLLPLLGLTNVLNMIPPPLEGSIWKFTLWSYGTYFMRSFQGFFIAFMYCFMNHEVQTVVRKRYSDWTAVRASARRGISRPSYSEQKTPEETAEKERKEFIPMTAGSWSSNISEDNPLPLHHAHSFPEISEHKFVCQQCIAVIENNGRTDTEESDNAAYQDASDHTDIDDQCETYEPTHCDSADYDYSHAYEIVFLDN